MFLFKVMRSKCLNFIISQPVILNKRLLSRNNYQLKICHLKLSSKIVRFKAVNNYLIRELSSAYDQSKELKNDNSESSVSDLIIFNSYKNFVHKKLMFRESLKRDKILSSKKPLSVSLKYLNPGVKLEESTDDIDRNPEQPEHPDLINFPYSVQVSGNDRIINAEEINDIKEEPSIREEERNNQNYFPQFHFSGHGRKWMNDYEKYTEEDNEVSDDIEGWRLDYGTPKPGIPVSKTPCGGCGAFLHCQDSAIPGYLPSEIFLKCNNKDLLSIICQRCHFMKHYNTALAITVDQNLYPKLLAKLKNETALVILMVDLTDFPCSIWPGILDVIGKKRPLFVVGNKVDLLWGDHKSWLNHVLQLLKSSFPNDANIKHVSLISATTGFGVEELINKLHNLWQYKGDVYLIGCTNVGKSTLFNALLQSDYCKVKAVDLLQRATTSLWPGTTLNLLKFPILRPESWRLYLRTLRLINNRKKANYEKQMRKVLMKSTKTKSTTPPQLIGHIGRTFTKKPLHEELQSENNFTIPNRKQMNVALVKGSGLDPDDPDFALSKWFYDTPGVLHSDQILDLLTTEELVLTIPKQIIEPRTFSIKPNWTIFIAGIARLDYSEGSAPIKLTVFSSSSLPVTVCNQTDADQIYNEFLGTEYMLVPKGSHERLKEWPNLQMAQKISLIGCNLLNSCADIILSSAGWIAVTAEAKQICKFIPWTPLGRGVHVRIPALLPNAVNLRGKKIRGTPAYGKSKPFVD